MQTLNAYQKAVARTYGGGDYAYLAEKERVSRSEFNVGDTLFTFLMVELSDAEGCDGKTEALRRLGNAVNDVLVAIDAVKNDVEE